MPELKTITISIPVDVYQRVDKLCPSKRKGQNRVRDFLTNVFMQGLESLWFLKLENRRLATTLKLLEPLIKQQQPQINLSAFDSVARDVEEFRDMAAKKPSAEPVTDNPAGQDPTQKGSNAGDKSPVH